MRFKRRVKELTGRSWGVSMDYRQRKLSEYLRGWMAYFALSEYYSPVPGLDEWIRRRVRMCYWKQWRRCRKRVGELLKLGVSKEWAIPVALSRKSYWHLSRTMATQWGMNDAWLKSQGLVSVRDLWIAFSARGGSASGMTLPGSKSVRETCRITVNLLNRRMRTRKSGGPVMRRDSSMWERGANHSPRPASAPVLPGFLRDGVANVFTVEAQSLACRSIDSGRHAPYRCSYGSDRPCR